MTEKTPRPAAPWPTGGPIGPHGPGDDDGRCHAKSKQTQERCRQRAMLGQRVCYAHGGRAGKAKSAAQRRLAAEKVAQDVKDALAFESLDGVTDPLAALSRLADEALAMKEALAARVNSLNSIRYSAAGAGTEQLRAEVALYERAMDRSAKFLDLLVKSGFEERRTALAEQQGKLVAQAVRAILTGMLAAVLEQLRSAPVPAETLTGMEAAWSQAVGEVVPRELRALIGGGEP